MKKTFIFFLLFLSGVKLSAQLKTTYLDNNYQDCKKRNATYLLEITEIGDSITKKIKSISTGRTKVIYKLHKSNTQAVYSYNYDDWNILLNEGLFINKSKEGEWIYYDRNEIIDKKSVYEKDQVILEKYMDSGIVSMEIPYKNGRYSGEGKIYYKGILAKKVTFENGFVLKNEDFIAMDSITDNDSVPKLAVQIMPTFVGGEDAMMNFIIKNVKYPKKAMENLIEGTVKLKFTLDTSGFVKNIEIISKEKLGYGCEEEAKRVIRSMPRWNAGLQNGVPVNVYFNLPITFQLY